MSRPRESETSDIVLVSELCSESFFFVDDGLTDLYSWPEYIRRLRGNNFY